MIHKVWNGVFNMNNLLDNTLVLPNPSKHISLKDCNEVINWYNDTTKNLCKDEASHKKINTDVEFAIRNLYALSSYLTDKTYHIGYISTDVDTLRGYLDLIHENSVQFCGLEDYCLYGDKDAKETVEVYTDLVEWGHILYCGETKKFIHTKVCLKTRYGDITFINFSNYWMVYVTPNMVYLNPYDIKENFNYDALHTAKLVDMYEKYFTILLNINTVKTPECDNEYQKDLSDTGYFLRKKYKYEEKLDLYKNSDYGARNRLPRNLHLFLGVADISDYLPQDTPSESLKLRKNERAFVLNADTKNVAILLENQNDYTLRTDSLKVLNCFREKVNYLNTLCCVQADYSFLRINDFKHKLELVSCNKNLLNLYGDFREDKIFLSGAYKPIVDFLKPLVVFWTFTHDTDKENVVCVTQDVETKDYMIYGNDKTFMAEVIKLVTVEPRKIASRALDMVDKDCRGMIF